MQNILFWVTLKSALGLIDLAQWITKAFSQRIKRPEPKSY